MKISIAMCTYKGASYLQQQLDSIAAQTRLPDELIVCDDGSTDDTLEILERFSLTAPFETLVVRNPANLGYSRNFAKAVALCSGEIIALCDQDDIWYPNKLSRLELLFTLHPRVDGIFSDGDLIDSTSRLTGRTLWQSFLFDLNSQADFNAGSAIKVLLQRNVVTGMTLAFRSRVKGLLESVPKIWVHDGWLALLIAARSQILAAPEMLVAYRIHNTQQVGAPVSLGEKLRWITAHGAGTYLKRLRERNILWYEQSYQQFTQMAEFLRKEGRPQERAFIALLEEKAAHARRGELALNSGRLRRLFMLAPHLESYDDFSPNGLRSFSRDLLI